jgi:four helix bundle protein
LAVSSLRSSVAWQKAMELSKAVYQATRRFPPDERFGLTNQLRRAAVSVPSNIAEGRGRLSQGEFLQFLGIARGSALEVETQLELAMALRFGDRVELESTQELAVEVGTILNASIATLREAISAKRSLTTNH